MIAAAQRADLLTEWQAQLPANIDPTTARLPVFYEAAKNALERCLQIDEVKGWSDRASALATYAREANDKSLRHMAERIHLRAVARIGELLLQIPAAKGGLPVGRYAAARDAGLSNRCTTKALAIGRMPRAQRNAAIDADAPPSMRSLERLAPPSSDVPAHLFRVSSEFYRALSRDNAGLFPFCAWLERFEQSPVDLTEEERARVLARIADARRGLRKLQKIVRGGPWK